MNTVKTIVIGTSLKEEGDGVVRTGVTLARAAGAAVYLVHAYTPPLTLYYGYNGFPSERAAVDADWMEDQEQVLRQQVQEQARRAGLTDLRPEHVIITDGVAHLALAETAEALQADLIVVGASDSGGRHRWRLSPTADRTVRRSKCPVLVVRPESTFPPARVLLPVDFSPVSAHAFRYGMDLLSQGNLHARVEALFALNPIAAEGSIQFSAEQMRHFAAEELSRFVAANSSEADWSVVQKVRTGYPWPEIVKELHEWDGDLVILGTHGHSRLERLLIGSVTADVLREAPCSVLAVPRLAVGEEAAQDVHEGARKGADWSYVADEIPA
jgi:nucleotide-binding universal stress UspA family protein